MSDSMFKLNIEEVFTLIVEVYTIAEYIFGCFIDLYICVYHYSRAKWYTTYINCFKAIYFSFLVTMFHYFSIIFEIFGISLFGSSHMIVEVIMV